MITLQMLKDRKNEIYLLASHYHATNIRVFGSVQRKENILNSDIDLLVSFEKGASLIDQVSLSRKLSQLLESKVDVLSDRGINKHLEKSILSEAQDL